MNLRTIVSYNEIKTLVEYFPTLELKKKFKNPIEKNARITG